MMVSRKCWTCGHEHDLDEACPQAPMERATRSAGGSLLFGQGAGTGEKRYESPAFRARFDSECAACDGAIFVDDLIRADGYGGYVHYPECEEL